jgi:hypothetical protein
MRKTLLPALLVLLVSLPGLGQGQDAAPDFKPGAKSGAAPEKFTPDPDKVLRWGKGYRYPQQGWIVVHVEGEPYERGYQHGRLLAPEIAAYCRCFAQQMCAKAPEDCWKTVRMFVNAVFLRKYDQEYLEEMKGIAAGASAAGARFDGRPIDLVDIVAMNSWAEIESLDAANAATPTGLEGKLFKDPAPDAKPLPRGEHCSAFAATGPATADGKVVFGHITMFSLYPANFYNIWLDVQPTKGHRFVMCSYPGGIQSGMDYYLADSGLLINETTISQTKFDINGMTCASRIRKAIQYADTIDQAVQILAKDNNGLYTNEWLLADINTNEVAMFELGTHKHKLWRSSKNEWFGDTPGFYWGCNNIKDMEVRLETIPSVKGKPQNLTFRPSGRDLTWQKLYEKHKGKIGVEFGKEAFASPIIATHPSSLDAKFTTSDMAKELRSYAFWGPPTGRTWNPTAKEKELYPEIKALEPMGWTVLGTTAPAADVGREAPLFAKDPALKGPKGGNLQQPPAWRGTLLPKADGDLWLAIAFAEYERKVADEHANLKKGDNAEQAAAKLDKAVANYRTLFTNAAKRLDVPLAELKFSTTSSDWYNVATSKGVLLLHALRKKVGREAFDKAMDDFGMKHGGTRVSSQAFQEHLEQATGKKLEAFFKMWLTEKGLPAAETGVEEPQEVSAAPAAWRRAG